jgi:RNA polymerase sigma-70 factor (ECF subfamily)
MPAKKTRNATPTSRPSHAPAPPEEPQPLSPVKSESRAEDARLIQRALRGDQFAYKQLMKKYHDPIFNLVYRMIHDKQQVEDLTQETFVKAFASLKYFNEEYAFSTWLYKIATNSSIDFIRKKKLNTFSIDKPVAMEESDFSFELPDTTYQPDKTLIQHQRTSMIEEAIAQLPEKYRRVIVLRHTEERDYAEIAKMLKLPIGTVKAHIFRARELLNKALRERMKHY